MRKKYKYMIDEEIYRCAALDCKTGVAAENDV
jgi:hypothetical protein